MSTCTHGCTCGRLTRPWLCGKTFADDENAHRNPGTRTCVEHLPQRLEGPVHAHGLGALGHPVCSLLDQVLDLGQLWQVDSKLLGLLRMSSTKMAGISGVLDQVRQLWQMGGKLL